MNDTQVCIHIGLSKTATTTLQNQFFPHHSEIEYLGKYNLIELQMRPKFYNEHVTYILEQIQRCRIDTKQAKTLKQLFNKKVLPMMDSNKLLVISSEGIATGPLSDRIRRAENFKAIFGACKIIIVLREPLDLIESLYFEKLKAYNLRDQAIWKKLPHCFSIEQWLKKHWKTSLSGPLWHLDYYQTIKAYCDIFGQKNVGIFLFEQLKEDPATFKHNISSFAGIMIDKGIDLIPERKDNERWNQEQIDKLWEIHGSLVQSLRYRFSPTKQNEEALGLTMAYSSGNSKKATAKIPDTWRARIQEYTRPGNGVLMSRWGLSLDKYNYPL